MGAIVDAVDAMEAAISGAMLPAMLDVAEGVETDAKTGHTFRNRTGRLEKSITHGAATGNLRHGYRVDVIARTRYASFVDEGTSRNAAYPYLVPAWERRETWAQHVVETAIVEAVDRLP